jgi:hypothetical protein
MLLFLLSRPFFFWVEGRAPSGQQARTRGKVSGVQRSAIPLVPCCGGQTRRALFVLRRGRFW